MRNNKFKKHKLINIKNISIIIDCLDLILRYNLNEIINDLYFITDTYNK